MREKAVEYLKRFVAETLQMESNQIDPSQSLENYGIDSILVRQLTGTLQVNFPEISNTLFFEFANINEIVSYLIENEKKSLTELIDSINSDFLHLNGIEIESQSLNEYFQRGNKKGLSNNL